MIDELKIMLGDAVEAYTEEQIGLALKMALAEIEGYCRRTVAGDYELEMVAMRIAIIRLNRINTEGLTGQSYSSVSQSYLDGLPADLKTILNSKRKIKVL